MTSPAYTRADLDALDAAIASGASEVHYAGRRVVYRSAAELIAARNLVAAALSPRPRRGSVYRFRPVSGRGD